jgi:hypothetical protein
MACCRGSHQHNPVYPYIFDRAIAQQMALSAGSRMIKGRGCWAQKIYLCSIHVIIQVLLILRGTIPPKGKNNYNFFSLS